MDQTAAFEQERPRLLRVATRVLSDPSEAQDVVQNAWLRMEGTKDVIHNLPGWLTTVTTRLCLDRLRARTPLPVADVELVEAALDPADEVALADTVGAALHVVLDRLTPAERVAFVLHDNFGVDFPTIAEILGRTPPAARKLASRARGKISKRMPQPPDLDRESDWEAVDAFLAAARNGDFTRLLALLAPAVVVEGDTDAVALGTPERLVGAHHVAQFFDGAARAALPIYIGPRAGAAWFHRGEPKVVFDFTIDHGVVRRIDFRAEPRLLAQVERREDSRRIQSQIQPEGVALAPP